MEMGEEEEEKEKEEEDGFGRRNSICPFIGLSPAIK